MLISRRVGQVTRQFISILRQSANSRLQFCTDLHSYTRHIAPRSASQRAATTLLCLDPETRETVSLKDQVQNPPKRVEMGFLL